MCLFKNGVGVIFSNGDRAIVINNMLIGTDVCIDIESYNGDYSNNINSNLNIVKIYSHLSDKWNQVKGNYIYGLLKNIEDSELLFDYERYKITIRDITSLYCVGDADYKYPSNTIDGKKATDGANRNVFYCYYSCKFSFPFN